MALLIRFIWNLIKLPFLPFWWLIRAFAKPKPAWVFLRLYPDIVEFQKPKPWFFRFIPKNREQKSTTLDDVRLLEKHLRQDKKIKGVVFTLRPLTTGWATLTSLRNLIQSISEKHPTIVYLPYGGGQKELYVASAAKEVIVHPHATLSLLGVSLESQYFKKLLDKIGVQIEVISCGKYKTALEAVSRENISEGQKEQLEALSNGLHEIVTHALIEGREVSEEAVGQWFDKALFHGTESVKSKISNQTLYPDELEERFVTEDKKQKHSKDNALNTKAEQPSGSKEKKKKRKSPKPAIIRWDHYLGFKEAIFFSPMIQAPYIAIVDAQGAIVDSEDAHGKRICAPKMIEMLAELREDPKVLAIILAINSPGGSAIASDLIHREIIRLKKEKPVIACMGDVAASGGYYMAAAADHILCEQSTITGSIGVISAKLTAHDLQEKIGIGTHIIKTSSHADMYSPSRKLSEQEHALILDEMNLFYQRFVNVVAEGRNKKPEEIEPLAQGRVWLGKDALKVGLVDEIGGIERAITLAREKLSLPESVRDHVRAEWVTAEEPNFPVIPFLNKMGLGNAHLNHSPVLADFVQNFETISEPTRDLLQLIQQKERVHYYYPYNPSRF